MVRPTTVLFLAMSVALVASTLLLLYPAYAYSENVLYTRGVKLVAASLVTLTSGWVVSDVLYYGVVEVSGLGVIPQVFFTLSSGLFLWANWEFAKDFIVLEEQEIPDTFARDDGVAPGGFEQAIEDGSGEGEP